MIKNQIIQHFFGLFKAAGSSSTKSTSCCNLVYDLALIDCSAKSKLEASMQFISNSVSLSTF